MYKICFVSGVISRSGGTERVGSMIANELSKRGHDVTILSCWNQGKPHFFLENNIKVDYLLDAAKEGKLYRTYVYPILKMHRYIKRKRFDFIIDIDTELAIYTSLAIQGTQCKQISWEHFNYWTMQLLGEKRRFRAKKLIKKFASKLVVLTEMDRLKHIEEYNLSDDFVVAMPNPCFVYGDNEYNFANKKFIAVGRLAPPKKISDLLDAWSIVEKETPDWELDLVGSGELENELKEQCRNLQLERVSFLGQCNNLENIYQNASCLVMSSEYEGFPMVILEAQAFSLPVISYDCKTGPRDLINDGKNGFLVNYRDIQDLAKKMILFTKEKKRAVEMSINAYESVERYRVDKIVDKWEKMLKDIYDNSSKEIK